MVRKRIIRAAALVLTCFLFFICSGIYAPALAADPYIIKLESNEETEFRIWCVTNELTGTPLSDEFLDMTLVTITSGGTEYYKGTIRDMPQPASETIIIAADDRIWIDVSFSFSENADNRFQGVSYKLLWEFEASGKINMTGGSTLYSNLNINPGDEYGFSIMVENGNPPPLPTPPPDNPDPWNPDNPDDPTPTDKPGETEEPDDSDDTDDADDDPDKPDDSDDLGDSDVPDSGKDGSDGSSGIKTGDYLTPAKNGESIPLLIGSIVFLMFIICVFVRIILAERKRQTGKLK